MCEYIFDVTETDFEEKVIALSRRTPVLVDFWADWCPPCKALTPVLEKVVNGYGGRVLLAKVEVDDNMHLAGHYQLRGFPTVLMFVQGAEVGRFSGFKPEQTARDFIEDNLAG